MGCKCEMRDECAEEGGQSSVNIKFGNRGEGGNK